MAAQSRFSNPVGTRPADKFVSNSTNGMSAGKKRRRKVAEKERTKFGSVFPRVED